MKQLKVNLLAMAAIVVAAGTVAFKAPDAALQYWIFDGDDISQVKTAGSYSPSSTAPGGCEEEASLPCSLLVDANDREALQDYLDTKTTEFIMDQAVGQRN